MRLKDKSLKIQLSDHFTYRRLLRFVFPSIIMMIFTSIYGVVDGLFVSNYVGKTPFAAINLVMPFIMIFGGFGFMIGTGGSALVAKKLGEGDNDRANQYFSMLIMLTVLLGIIISAVGIAFIRKISFLLGATEDMIGDCVTYGTILISFTTAFMLQNVFQSLLITAEKPKLGLYVTVAAGVTNMVLDALFVAAFKWGLVGAAAATVLSQCVGGLLPLIYFIRPNSSLLKLVKTKLEWRPMLKACTNGSSELMSNISMSLVSIVYNFQLMRIAGENGVAAYGVIMYVNFIFIAIFIGYSVGSAPIVGYHFGAENHAELKNMLKKSLVLMGSAGLLLTALAEALASPLASLFVGYDAELFEMTCRAFRIFSISLVLAGVNILASSFFTALNNGAVSAAISFLRTLVFQMLAVLILPILLASDGIWLAIVVAEVLATAVSGIFLVIKRKQYRY